MTGLRSQVDTLLRCIEQYDTSVIKLRSLSCKIALNKYVSLKNLAKSCSAATDTLMDLDMVKARIPPIWILRAPDIPKLQI